jgi:hypothetical protein
LPQPHRGQSSLSLTNMWPACPALLFCRATHDRHAQAKADFGVPGSGVRSGLAPATQRRSAWSAATPSLSAAALTETRAAASAARVQSLRRLRAGSGHTPRRRC